MKKNTAKAQTTGLLFKIFTFFIFVASGAVIHLEYETHKVFLSDAAHVMKVNIETGYNNVLNNQNSSEKAESSGSGAINSREIEKNKVEQEIKDNNKISSDISDRFSFKTSLYRDMDMYRGHLASVANLIEKFLKCEDYDGELKFLIEKDQDYPKDIQEILHKLSDYRVKYLNSMQDEYSKVNLNGGIFSRIIGKIIDIESKNPQHSEKEVVYKELSSKLDMLKTYFYSEEFLKKYISND